MHEVKSIQDLLNQISRDEILLPERFLDFPAARRRLLARGDERIHRRVAS